MQTLFEHKATLHVKHAEGVLEKLRARGDVADTLTQLNDGKVFLMPPPPWTWTGEGLLAGGFRNPNANQGEWMEAFRLQFGRVCLQTCAPRFSEADDFLRLLARSGYLVNRLQGRRRCCSRVHLMISGPKPRHSKAMIAWLTAARSDLLEALETASWRELRGACA